MHKSHVPPAPLCKRNVRGSKRLAVTEQAEVSSGETLHLPLVYQQAYTLECLCCRFDLGEQYDLH